MKPASGALAPLLLLLWQLGAATASLAAHAGVLRLRTLQAPAGAPAPAAKGTVERVVDLLKDLKDKLTADGASEQQVYDKYACWCEKTTDRKAGAIEDAKKDLRSLGQEILKQKGLVASLTTEIQETAKDIKENEEAQREATAIRQQENAAYQAESAELKQALAALEKALLVLKEAQGGSAAALLQQGARGGASAAAQRRLASALATAQSAAAGAAPAAALARKQPGASRSSLALLRASTQEFLRTAAHEGLSYAPQSATITGILENMYSTFTEDLQSKITAEATQNHNFEALMATKQQELLELQDKIQKAEKDKAEAEVMLAEAAQSYDDTDAQLKADITFFDATKGACVSKSEEWGERKTMRTEELAGINKALEILSSDEARDLFQKAIKPTPAAMLLQLSAEKEGAAWPAEKAYQALKKQATQTHSLRLAHLAAAVRLAKVGHFDEVIAAIDKLLVDLQAEQTDDTAKRDQCLAEYQKINSTTADLKWKIEVNNATIAKLEDSIKKDEDEKAATIEQITEVEKQITDMNATRKAENEAFLQAKKDDEDAIALLQTAKEALSSYYKNHSVELGPLEGAGLLQQGPDFARSADDAPEATFSDKGTRKGQAKGIVAILTQIIEGLQGEIAAEVSEEASAQLEYEKQVAAANALLLTLQTKKINLETAIVSKQETKDQETKTKEANQADLKDQEDYRAQITKDCDWIIGAFDTRRQKRSAEAEGLTQAKAFLAGYQPAAGAALLAKPGGAAAAPAAGARRAFDDTAFGRISFASIPSLRGPRAGK